MCELLLCSVHSSSYSGGKQKSDRQIYYSVIDITDTMHNKVGRLFKTKQCRCSAEALHFFRVGWGGGAWWGLVGGWELINIVCIGMTATLHGFKTTMNNANQQMLVHVP